MRRPALARSLLLMASVLVLAVGAGLALRPAKDDPPQPTSAIGPGVTATTRTAVLELRRDGGRLIDDDTAAFRSRLARLRGVPVVVNQWASWCGPCRFEFPFFARVAELYGNRVAFLGVNSKDDRARATSFLKEFPTSFPHVFDPDVRVARTFRGGRSWPMTAFYNRDGGLTKVHYGGYPTATALNDDIRRWALGG